MPRRAPMASDAAAAAAAGDGGAAVSSSGIVPISAVEALAKTLGHAEEVRAQLSEFLAAADPDALADLPPLRRARAFLALARAASSLFSVRLRCSGINPDDHPMAKELERLSLHEEKLERFESWSKAPLRPSTTLNYQAATRFIGHSLPHLTSGMH
ncbi:Nuclear nucleic acid-binding protein C1D [Ananas comosus]|uniref:Nuclear nucleic acid-binding protein C1D n=1 Tax=Ananas comosus TaxID=4615 RepID=A0A199V4K5_ANACO|nr:Nuclear nucleic acid-binding protein C1D [Ananas comosus]